LMKF